MPQTELVFSVKELEQNLPFYLEGLGMNVAHQGNAKLDGFYQIRTDMINEVLLVRDGEEFGNIRLVEFKGVAQELIRPNGSIWDTGGIYDFDVRVVGLENTMLMLREYDWRGNGESVTYSTGGLILNEGFLRGHDDIVIALIERTKPPLANKEAAIGVSTNAFNSAMVVSDYEESKHFLIDILGFQVYHEDEVTWSEGPNILNLPHNLVDKARCKMLMVSAQKDSPVMIEIVQFPDLTGMDFSMKAHPPNLGILSFRFSVQNIDNFYSYIQERDVTICSHLQDVLLEPYGAVKAFAIETPDGAWMEFYEVTS